MRTTERTIAGRELTASEAEACRRKRASTLTLSSRATRVVRSLACETVADLAKADLVAAIGRGKVGPQTLVELRSAVDVVASGGPKKGASRTIGGRSFTPAESEFLRGTSITELRLSPRAAAAVASLGVEDAFHLATTSRRQFLDLPHIGTTTAPLRDHDPDGVARFQDSS